jgi:hypothetical protein
VNKILSIFLHKIFLDYWKSRPETPEEVVVLKTYKFAVHDPVRTIHRFIFEGHVVSVFETLSGVTRYAVEHDQVLGLVQVFYEEELTMRLVQKQVEEEEKCGS